MTTHEIAALLGSIRDRRGVLRLLRALGLRSPAERRVLRLPESCGSVRAHCVASLGAMHAWLLEPALVDPAAVGRAARWLAAVAACEQQLVVAVPRGCERVVIGALDAGDEFRHLLLEPHDVRGSDIDTIFEMVAQPGEAGLALAARYARALDRERIGRRFFDGLRLQRARIAVSWRGVPARARAARAELALLLICRLLFLYFLQRRGHLAGSTSYMADQLRRWRVRPAAERGTFYRRVLRPLFFGALNRRPERRDRHAAALGALPYLNGGLFERVHHERVHGRLDIADAELLPLFDELLERYRFTTHDAASAAAAAVQSASVDPEMLGRVFEGMMLGTRRRETGTFFTPPATVDRVVRETLALRLATIARLPLPAVGCALDGDAAALDAEARVRLLRASVRLRVLDPACGSGAFLLGALTRLARLRALLGEGAVPEARRRVVADALHGVDVQSDAALLCALRLWLALAAETDVVDGVVPPLPNLDRSIRQGDSLVDPLDLGASAVSDDIAAAAARSLDVRRARAALVPDAARYGAAQPHERTLLARRLSLAEHQLALCWFDALRERHVRRLAELRAQAAALDLFGEPTDEARHAAARAVEVERGLREIERWRRRLRRRRELPFFSYAVHFAASGSDGFDVVVSNPPWLRARRWSRGESGVLRSRYEICRSRDGHHAPGQVDLSLLFLERSLRLCAPGGTVGLVLPAKLLRSAYAAGARRLLLRETRITSIDDHSLDQRAVFAADAFAATVVLQRRDADERCADEVRVRLDRRGVAPLDFAIDAAALPLDPGDAGSPWLIAPAAVRAALRRMQQRGRSLGAARGGSVTVRRGVVTGANDVLIAIDAVPRLGELVEVRCEGARLASASAAARAFELFVERSQLRPLLRGSDVGAFAATPRSHVLWVLSADGRYAPSPRLRRYLAQHEARLSRGGRLQRLAADTLGPKVVWKDIASTLEACAVAASVESGVCGSVPVIPLNTVYYAPCATHDEALLLAAYLNSLPVRVFACVIAERAKDARFRFFAGTLAAVPLPPAWRVGPGAQQLHVISQRAHAAGVIDERDACSLDEIVASRFGLGAGQLDELRAFERWLRGRREAAVGSTP